MYFYTAAFILALFFNILSVVGSSRVSAQLKYGYACPSFSLFHSFVVVLFFLSRRLSKGFVFFPTSRVLTVCTCSLAYAGLFAVFGLSYTLSIAGEVLPGNRSAARAGGVFVWISFIAMTASSHFVLQEVEDSRPSAGYEEYYEEVRLSES